MEPSEINKILYMCEGAISCCTEYWGIWITKDQRAVICNIQEATKPRIIADLSYRAPEYPTSLTSGIEYRTVSLCCVTHPPGADFSGR